MWWDAGWCGRYGRRGMWDGRGMERRRRRGGMRRHAARTWVVMIIPCSSFLRRGGHGCDIIVSNTDSYTGGKLSGTLGPSFTLRFTVGNDAGSDWTEITVTEDPGAFPCPMLQEEEQMKALIPTLASAAVLVSLGGCDSDPAGTEVYAESFLRALAVAPESSTVHRGTAQYSGGTMSDTHRKLTVISRDPEVDSWVHLQMLSSRPQRIDTIAGSFSLEPRDFLGGDNEGTTALYLRDGKRFVAESGTLTISEASGDILEGRITGEFEFTAVHWCTPAVDRTPCLSLPSEFPASALRIHLTGEFVAVPPPPAERLHLP